MYVVVVSVGNWEKLCCIREKGFSAFGFVFVYTGFDQSLIRTPELPERKLLRIKFKEVLLLKPTPFIHQRNLILSCELLGLEILFLWGPACRVLHENCVMVENGLICFILCGPALMVR